MTRHRRHSWQQIALRTATGVLLAAETIHVSAWAVHTGNGLFDLATIALGATAGMLFLVAASWAVSLGWHHGRQQYLVKAAAYTPLRRRRTRPADNEPLIPAVPKPDDIARANEWAGSGPITPRPYIPQATAAANGPAS